MNFKSLSLYSCIACFLLMAYTSFVSYPRWKQQGGEALISWDVSGYYMYLPAAFIYKDIKHFSFRDSVINKYQPGDYQAFKVDNGNYVFKYSAGMAVMYSPFFAIANALATPLGYPKDGFSPPYQLAVQLGGFLVALIGIWYFRKLLLQFYSDTVAAITLLLLVFGSNYLNYGGVDLGMSHAWLFTIYTFILLNTNYFYKAQHYKYVIRLGFLIGLATLARPTEIISCFIPLLWGLERISLETIRERFSFLIAQRRRLLVAAVCAAIGVAT